LALEITLLQQHNAAALDHVAPGVFDHAINPEWTAAFLSDSRHHLAMALAEGQVVGMASAVHYVHPDKPPELWINEVGVAPSHQGQGVGRALLQALLQQGKRLGCVQAWVLTDRANTAAMRLYASAGGVEEPIPSVMFSFSLSPTS